MLLTSTPDSRSGNLCRKHPRFEKFGGFHLSRGISPLEDKNMLARVEPPNSDFANRARCRALNSFKTTLAPNQEKSYKMLLRDKTFKKRPLECVLQML